MSIEKLSNRKLATLMERFLIVAGHGGWNAEAEAPVVGETFNYSISLIDDPDVRQRWANIVEALGGPTPAPIDRAPIPLTLSPSLSLAPADAVEISPQFDPDEACVTVGKKATWRFNITARRPGLFVVTTMLMHRDTVAWSELSDIRITEAQRPKLQLVR